MTPRIGDEHGDAYGDVPPLRSLATTNPCETSFMRYFAARGGAPGLVEPQTWTPLAGISPTLIAAAIKAEDPRFFTHHGADWRAIARKATATIRKRKVVGGASTITQQLARNLYLTPTRSLTRKLRELWIALLLERVCSKPRIVELYLNLIEWGRDVWGCAAASAYYFGKTPRELDLFESTFLVSVIPAPKTPLTGRRAKRSAKAQLSLAYRLLLSGVVDCEECARCCRRVRELHRLLALGTPLIPALSESARITGGDGGDGAVLRGVMTALDLRLLPRDRLMASRYGEEQERLGFDRARARFGWDVLLEVKKTGSLGALLPAPRSQAGC